MAANSGDGTEDIHHSRSERKAEGRPFLPSQVLEKYPERPAAPSNSVPRNGILSRAVAVSFHDGLLLYVE